MKQEELSLVDDQTSQQTTARLSLDDFQFGVSRGHELGLSGDDNGCVGVCNCVDHCPCYDDCPCGD
jgi:hypothetical protein